MKAEDVDIKKCFPFKSIRSCQETALKAIVEEIGKSNKKYFIIDAETGVGKSALAIAAAKYISQLDNIANPPYEAGTYVLTTQKILQDQYTKDFAKTEGLRGIRSSANYNCKRIPGITCAASLRTLKSGREEKSGHSACKHDCVYKKKKKEFIEGHLGVTNYSYFLAETYYSGQVEPKKTLIIDEAHNLVGELSKFVEIKITEKFTKQALKINFPGKLTQKQAIKWISKTYLPRASAKLAQLQNDVKKFLGANKLKDFESIANQIELVDKHVCKLNRFLQSYKEENWVFNFVPREGKSSARFEFKPIDVGDFANSMVFNRAERVILMSATILSKDKFCELLGLDPNEVGYIHIESPFPLENRPVIYSGVGKMSYKNIEQTLPKLAEAIKLIIESHPNDKGIIHAHSYKVANYIKKNIRNRRILTHDSSNRDQVLLEHIESDKPTVLLSPSMQEGVDLKDDLSRFQIICKVPYPYLGDKLIKKRMYRWRWWYDYETLKTIVQSIGRSVRNETDHAITYILDEDWKRFAVKNKESLPSNLAESIK